MAYTTIDDPELYFQIKLYTGNGTDDTAITLDGAEDMAPNFVWIKKRNSAEDHVLFDTIRGATKYIKSNSEDAEATDTGSLKSFNSDGFTLGTAGRSNNNTNTFVAWCWKESATAGFDIVSYSGTGSARTQAHSLSAKPNWIIAKKTSASGGAWFVYLTGAVPATNYMKLNEDQATSASSSMWNNTEPTSSVFSLGTSSDVNGDGVTYVAYLWRSVQGFSKFSNFVGNGNVDGTFVYTGFRPAFIILKSVTGSGDGWFMANNKSNPFNRVNKNLFANLTNAESTNGTAAGDKNLDFLSNGFKIRTTNSECNSSGVNYIYLAFAESPFVNSNGAPCNAR
jgi:hypothetical protein